MAYLKRQAVREESGFQQDNDFRGISGVVDGVNRSFTVPEIPIVDRNRDDAVTTADIIVRVDGVNTSVDSIDAATGEVVLTAAPDVDSVVEAMWATSKLPDAVVDEYISEAESIVNGAIEDYVLVVPLESDDKNFPRARLIARLFAGGFALTRDYGAQADTEDTSKDGYKKIEEAHGYLSKLADELKSNASSVNKGGSVRVRNAGAVFPSYTKEELKDATDRFMRH